MSAADQSDQPDQDVAARILCDVPDYLWPTLLRAVRRAVDAMDASDIPAALRPYAHWMPERLATGRPRQVIAKALASDYRLRAAVGGHLADNDAYAAAESADAGRLSGRYGAAVAVAALVARGRWSDIPAVAAQAADRRAGHGHAAAESMGRSGADADRSGPARSGGAGRGRGRRPSRRQSLLAATRRERAAARRRAQRADERARSAAEQYAHTEARCKELLAEVDRLTAELARQRVESRQRLARVRRRLREAERNSRRDSARAELVTDDVAQQLQALASALRAGGQDDPLLDADAATASAGTGLTPRLATQPQIPRQVRPATAGRPCRLPAGIVDDTVPATLALLQVAGLRVLLDGYNVTLGRLGVAGTPLPQQRRWLSAVMGGLVARYGTQVVIVYDGRDERSLPERSPRGVQALFTAEDEIADDRIVALVDAEPEAAMLIVSSDRELGQRVAERGANVVTVAVFLDAIGA